MFLAPSMHASGQFLHAGNVDLTLPARRVPLVKPARCRAVRSGMAGGNCSRSAHRYSSKRGDGQRKSYRRPLRCSSEAGRPETAAAAGVTSRNGWTFVPSTSAGPRRDAADVMVTRYNGQLKLKEWHLQSRGDQACARRAALWRVVSRSSCTQCSGTEPSSSQRRLRDHRDGDRDRIVLPQGATPEGREQTTAPIVLHAADQQPTAVST